MRVFGLGVMVLGIASFGLPMAATAQPGGGEVGACLLLNIDTGTTIPGLAFDGGVPVGFNACVDAVDQTFCECEDIGDGTDDGKFGECIFLPGETCAEQDIPWDGACDAQGICFALQSPIPGASQQLCENSEFPWYPGTTICGGVPTLPKVAMAALALALLVGSLTVLTLTTSRNG